MVAVFYSLSSILTNEKPMHMRRRREATEWQVHILSPCLPQTAAVGHAPFSYPTGLSPCSFFLTVTVSYAL